VIGNYRTGTTSGNMPSVLIIDDNLLIRRGLRSVLQQQYREIVFGEARNGDEALAAVAGRKWDLIIMDIGAPFKSSGGLLGEIRKRYPAARVLAMSPQTDLRHAIRAQEIGATGYAGKDSAPAELTRAVRDVLAGQKHFDGLHLLENAEAILPTLNTLSPREYRVMLSLGNGKRATDIAAELNLSIKTVSTYKRRLLTKLRLNSLADLVRYVIDNKLS
jgi:two-component system, NarL family, invasion response regulator UvrY